MDPILADIYSTVAPSMPYLIAGYALLWAALMVFVGLVWRRTKSIEKKTQLLEEMLADDDRRSHL